MLPCKSSGKRKTKTARSAGNDDDGAFGHRLRAQRTGPRAEPCDGSEGPNHGRTGNQSAQSGSKQYILRSSHLGSLDALKIRLAVFFSHQEKDVQWHDHETKEQGRLYDLGRSRDV